MTKPRRSWFKQGNKVSVGHGRPRLPVEAHTLNMLTKTEFSVLLNKILSAKPDELKNYNKTVLEVWLASGAAKAIQSGDYSRLTVLLERLIGKVPDKVEVGPLEQMSDEDLLEAGKEALELIEAKKKEET